jgi:tRNA G18 (ribose-2'-O)-methylase SpoU
MHNQDEDEVGVGPWPGDWPDGAHYDPALLAAGDRRNVVDRYRYWRLEAIVADLDLRRHGFHVAIENWQHDLNIGTVVRNANAFLAAEVHIVGRRRWNRRGAMVTDRYQHVRHHPTVEEFLDWTVERGLPVIGIDNLPGALPLERAELPRHCVLLFGQEGPGLSEPARKACAAVYSIAQYGSTRSINAGVASGIAMHAWIRLYGDNSP